jgi:hypothetical protein
MGSTLPPLYDRHGAREQSRVVYTLLYLVRHPHSVPDEEGG